MGTLHKMVCPASWEYLLMHRISAATFCFMVKADNLQCSQSDIFWLFVRVTCWWTGWQEFWQELENKTGLMNCAWSAHLLPVLVVFCDTEEHWCHAERLALWKICWFCWFCLSRKIRYKIGSKKSVTGKEEGCPVHREPLLRWEPIWWQQWERRHGSKCYLWHGAKCVIQAHRELTCD